MRVTARSAILIGLASLCLYADAEKDVNDLFSSLTASLVELNVPGFMDAFDKNMPDYERLKTYVEALVNQADVASSIEPVANEGNDTKRSVDLDWLLEVRSLLQDGPIVRRREVIHCEVEKQGKRWKIVSLKPIDFFAPANLTQ